MNWLDIIIIVVFGFFIFKGFRKGFVQQIADLIGSVVALILAFYFHQQAGAVIADLVKISVPLANVLGFIFIVVIFGGIVSYLGKRWRASSKGEPIAVVDGSLGAVLGGTKAAMILTTMLLLMLAMPFNYFSQPIAESNFAKDLLRLAPAFQLLQETLLPANVPRMLISADGLKWRNIDYGQLYQAKCIACGGKVEYQGMVKKTLLSYPQAVCKKCGRTSDGCLTFEGYHLLHGVCPYERLGSMGTIDCQTWPNVEPTTVKGSCSVCGRKH
ncbi:MAG TPA: CvpA family protein [Bacillota bacterium]|jgi:membrane protein required for colicin V production|nr:CvpA family protein [Bacillota bacterium]HOL08519.1 CvpA family protein [Bacillota bacterium]HPO97000.1 CvpA family protein [Bacillota bacterium]